MRLRLTIVAGLATLLASVGLYPLYESSGWFGTGFGAVLVVAAAGVLTRRFRVAAALCPLARPGRAVRLPDRGVRHQAGVPRHRPHSLVGGPAGPSAPRGLARRERVRGAGADAARHRHADGHGHRPGRAPGRLRWPSACAAPPSPGCRCWRCTACRPRYASRPSAGWRSCWARAATSGSSSWTPATSCPAGAAPVFTRHWTPSREDERTARLQPARGQRAAHRADRRGDRDRPAVRGARASSRTGCSGSARAPAPARGRAAARSPA